MSSKFSRLNTLFTTDAEYDALLAYLQTGQVPAHVASATQYQRRAHGFVLHPPGTIKHGALTLVAPRDHVHRLGELYHDENNLGIGKGIVGFYKLVCTKYIGITRDMCAAYLKEQAGYQLSRPSTTRVNKAIVSKYPNQVWGIDLIDCNHFRAHNTGWRYIMTVIDIFSRKIWLQKLKKKDAQVNRTALASIVARAGITPNQLIADNGTEFAGEFKEYCDEHQIKIRNTVPHNPQSNGVTERANQEIRKILRAIMLREESLVWHTHLRDVEENKNGSYSSTTKSTPDELWSGDKVPLPAQQLPEAMLVNMPKRRAQRAVLERAKAQIKRFREHEFQVGDLVRVRMQAIFANLRAKVKAGDTKNIIVHFTPLIFTIDRVIRPHNESLERNRYVLRNTAGHMLGNPGNGGIKEFYAVDLSLADEDANYDLGMTMDRALELNKIDRTNRDLTY